MLDVERQAFLAAVGPDEVRRQPVHALVVAAREVARARPLDLDHTRAEIGKLARTKRRRDRVLEGDNEGSGKGQHAMGRALPAVI